jgi:1,2-diacylglycerol 3-beta-glucosyltransferase
MMLIVTIALGAVALLLLLPLLSDAISLVRAAAVRPRSRATQSPGARLLFLVPAHDEGLLMDACVRSLVGMSYPAALREVVVIADNCSDDTAAVARAAGATCLERTDLERRGKPHALAWALEQLPYRTYDAVVIVDADTVVDGGFAAELAAVPDLRSRAVQAFHGVRNPEDSAITRMAAVLAAARYFFEFRLKARAGLNVPLMGNGMCIGSDVLAERGWTAFSICEDWELYAQLTERGVTIEGAPEARLHSQEARSLEQSSSQRTRWAAGKLTVLWRMAGPLLRSRNIGGHQKLDICAELVAPGPAVHLGLVAILTAFTVIVSPPGAGWLIAGLLLPVARTALYTLLAMRAAPQPLRTLLSFGYLPFYATWRLTVQLAALRMLGEKPWIRTQRHV